MTRNTGSNSAKRICGDNRTGRVGNIIAAFSAAYLGMVIAHANS